MEKDRIFLRNSILAFAFSLVTLTFVLFCISNETNSNSNNQKEQYKPKVIVTEKPTETPIPTVMPTPTVTPKPTQTPVYYDEIVKYKTVKCLSEHSITNWNSGTDRNANMAAAARIINGEKRKGYILEPDEIFSWLETVGETTAEKGFKTAGILINGHHAEGLGGGVCQVASTINSAAIKAGLETEAETHSANVGYLSPGDYEATVTYDGGKDLKVINTKEFPVRIKVMAKGQTVKVKIFRLRKIVEYVQTE